MKIGILTQPLKYNYGGLLQNFALQYILRQAGHEVFTYSWSSQEPSSNRSTKLYLILKLKKAVRYLMKNNKRITTENFNEFKDKYIDCSNFCISSDDFREFTLAESVQAIIVGSDQCWRPKYNFPHLEDMFMQFAKDIHPLKRISYAASFGTDTWEFSEEQSARCSNLIKMFDVVTTREESGIYLCQKYLGVNAKHVLDPTLLLDRSIYAKVVSDLHTHSSPGTLYYYILNISQEKKAFIEVMGKETSLVPFCVARNGQTVNNFPGIIVPPSVQSWIKGFIDAKMVVVDSFHGMVFSIIFNKPFWVIGNQSRGMARFESLLNMFGLTERLVDPRSFNIKDVWAPIDWDMVNTKLTVLKSDSINTLLNSLNE